MNLVCVLLLLTFLEITISNLISSLQQFYKMTTCLTTHEFSCFLRFTCPENLHLKWINPPSQKTMPLPEPISRECNDFTAYSNSAPISCLCWSLAHTCVSLPTLIYSHTTQISRQPLLLWFPKVTGKSIFFRLYK